MIKFKQLVLLLGDIILLYGALFLTIEVRYGHINDGLLRAHLTPFSIIFAVWLALFYSAGWYDLRTIRKNLVLLETVIVTLLIGFGVAIIVFYSIPYFHIAPKTNLAIFTVFFATFAFLWRVALGAIVKTPREKVLLIGSNADAEEVADHLEKNPTIGYKIQSHMPNCSTSDVEQLVGRPAPPSFSK